MKSIHQQTELWKAYDYFNRCIFNSQLIEILFVDFMYSLRKEGQFIHAKADDSKTHETYHQIVIDENLINEPNNYWASALVHQMIHLWQFQYGTKGKMEHHHNKEYVSKALEIGIIIKCGESNEQELKPDSLIISAIADMPEFKFAKPRNAASQLNKKGKGGRHFKFVCPNCNSHVSGNYNSLDICGVCHQNTGEILYRVRED